MKLVPEEFSTSWGALRSMGEAASDAGFTTRHALAFVILFALGFALGWEIFPSLIVAGKESALFSLLGGIVALGGLLSGFMVTLMLFSGKFEGITDFEIEQVVNIIHRIKLLLYSQAQTLFAAVFSSVFSVIWLCAYAASVSTASQQIVAGTCFGYLFVAVLRSTLVPLQIFEFHESYLATSKTSVIDRHRKRFSQNGRSQLGSGSAHRSEHGADQQRSDLGSHRGGGSGGSQGGEP